MYYCDSFRFFALFTVYFFGKGSALSALDMKYQLLMEALDEAPEVTITYFQPDERKAGGKYVSAVGAVKKIDDFERRITMRDGTRIPTDDVLSIDGELFSSLE